MCVDELARPTKLVAVSAFSAGILRQCHIDSVLNQRPTCLPLSPLCAHARSFPLFSGSTLSFFHMLLPFITIKCNAAQKRAALSVPGGSFWWCTLLSVRHSPQTSSLLTSRFVLSLALHRSVVPGYLPQLQPDADAGTAGYGSESPGSVTSHSVRCFRLFLSLHFTSRLAETWSSKMLIGLNLEKLLLVILLLVFL